MWFTINVFRNWKSRSKSESIWTKYINRIVVMCSRTIYLFSLIFRCDLTNPFTEIHDTYMEAYKFNGWDLSNPYFEWGIVIGERILPPNECIGWEGGKRIYCWNSMFMEGAEEFAMIASAVSVKTMVVPPNEGWEAKVGAKSTILIWIVRSGTQVYGVVALMHFTKYCLPHAAPLSHIPSPAAANKLLDGNCVGSLP